MISIHLTVFPGIALGVTCSRCSVGVLFACFALELEWH